MVRCLAVALTCCCLFLQYRVEHSRCMDFLIKLALFQVTQPFCTNVSGISTDLTLSPDPQICISRSTDLYCYTLLPPPGRPLSGPTQTQTPPCNGNQTQHQPDEEEAAGGDGAREARTGPRQTQSRCYTPDTE